MRKQVTFVDNLKKENLLKNGSGRIFGRSAECNKTCKDGFEYLHGQQVSEVHRGTHIKMSAGSQQVKTVPIPKSMMATPFLQHPALTSGQRRYLYSIANVYSTEHMRRQMKQHYLNVLHACIKSGQSSVGRRRYGDHLQKDKCMYKMDADKDVGSRPKPQGQRNSSSNTAHSEVTLPKIIKR